MPQKSLSQKGKCCRGGKNAKQGITAAFFGRQRGPYCDRKYQTTALLRTFGKSIIPLRAQYFSNEKAWMRTEIIIVLECELLPAANCQGFKPVVHSLFNNHLVDVQMDSVRNLITETCYNQLERSGEFKEVL